MPPFPVARLALGCMLVVFTAAVMASGLFWLITQLAGWLTSW